MKKREKSNDEERYDKTSLYILLSIYLGILWLGRIGDKPLKPYFWYLVMNSSQSLARWIGTIGLHAESAYAKSMSAGRMN